MTPVAALPPVGDDLALAVQSAGKDVGDFAHIWLNGVDVAAGTIGYNLAAIAPDGQLLDSAVFNTHADPTASAALVAWIQQWPAGTLVRVDAEPRRIVISHPADETGIPREELR